MKAFPIPSDSHAEYVAKKGEDPDGMDLRDYFAAKAMQSIVSALTTPTGLSNADEFGVSKAAYKVADAMMQARKQDNK